MKIVKLILFFVLIMGSFEVMAYKPKRTNSFSSYSEHTNEFGYGVNFSYLRYENKFSPQLHFHYSKYLTDFFSIGLGYGGIYDEHFHNTFNLELNFRVYKKVVFSLKPGMAYKQQQGQDKFLYAMGFGVNYEIPVSDKVHIGPMVEIDVLQDDVNYMAGFHMGFTF